MNSSDISPDVLIRHLTTDGLAIYLFHGVISRQEHRVRNYTRKHIEADAFAHCMRRIAHAGRPISMNDVLYFCDSGEPFPPRSFAVTFDDGFENNVSIAAPILADMKIPATIYITSQFVDSNGMSWIDRIEYAVEETPSRAVSVEWTSTPFRLTDAESRIAFLKAVRLHVKGDPTCDANAFADALCAELGQTGPMTSDDPLDLKLNWSQVRAANESDLLTVGGHSHTHPILTFLTPHHLACELDTNFALLKTKAGVDPTHFSYPEGLAYCYSDSVITELKRRGVRCSPTAIEGINAAGADPFRLRRIMIA